MEDVDHGLKGNGETPGKEYVPFKLEYLLDADENAATERYRLFKDPLRPWPILLRVTLDNVVLGTHIGINDEVNQYQAAGFSFDPGSLRYLIRNIEQDKEFFYKLGDGWHVPLLFSPFGEFVRVALYDQYFNEKIITFDHRKVKPVVVEKELVIREFSNFIAALKKDTDKYLPGSKVF